MDKKTKISTKWGWKLESEETKEQVNNYKTLKITESYRGISVIIISALLLLSIILGLFDVYPLSDIIFSLFIYIPILFFVYKGHRWSMILLFILWTFEKIYTAYLSTQNGSSPISSIIWWFIVAPYIYKAIIVENEHKNNKVINNSTYKYCTNCGNKQEEGAKFCTNCGFNLTQ